MFNTHLFNEALFNQSKKGTEKHLSITSSLTVKEETSRLKSIKRSLSVTGLFLTETLNTAKAIIRDFSLDKIPVAETLSYWQKKTVSLSPLKLSITDILSRWQQKTISLPTFNLSIAETITCWQKKITSLIPFSLSITDVSLNPRKLLRESKAKLPFTDRLTTLQALIRSITIDNLSLSEVFSRLRSRNVSLATVKLSLSEALSRFKSITKSYTILSVLAVTDSTWSRWRYNARVYYNSLRSYGGVVVFKTAAVRGLHKTADSFLAVKEELSRLRSLVRQFTADKLNLIEEKAIHALQIVKSLFNRIYIINVKGIPNRILQVINNSFSILESRLKRLRLVPALATDNLTVVDGKGIYRIKLIRVIVNSLHLRHLRKFAAGMIKIINHSFSIADKKWRRWKYNARVYYNSLRSYGGRSFYKVLRHRDRQKTVLLNIIDRYSLFRRYLRKLSFNVKLQEESKSVRGLSKSLLIGQLIIKDTISSLRRLFQVVTSSLPIREFVKRKRQTLFTLLGTAQTKLFFLATAYTRKVFSTLTYQVITVPCQIGGGATVKLDIYRGNDKAFELHIRDETGVNLDLTDSLITFMVKKTVKDTDVEAVITKTSLDEDEVKITQPLRGLCEVYLIPTDTISLSPRGYVYEAQVVTNEGMRYTVAMDVFDIKHVVKKS